MEVFISFLETDNAYNDWNTSPDVTSTEQLNHINLLQGTNYPSFCPVTSSQFMRGHQLLFKLPFHLFLKQLNGTFYKKISLLLSSDKSVCEDGPKEPFVPLSWEINRFIHRKWMGSLIMDPNNQKYLSTHSCEISIFYLLRIPESLQQRNPFFIELTPFFIHKSHHASFLCHHSYGSLLPWKWKVLQLWPQVLDFRRVISTTISRLNLVDWELFTTYLSTGYCGLTQARQVITLQHYHSPRLYSWLRTGHHSPKHTVPLPGLSFWGERSLSSTITRLNLVDWELDIANLSTEYCFTLITFKEWFSVKSLT
jgi:hypothetical protein